MNDEFTISESGKVLENANLIKKYHGHLLSTILDNMLEYSGDWALLISFLWIVLETSSICTIQRNRFDLLSFNLHLTAHCGPKYFPQSRFPASIESYQ
jgi:hypothetical protein